MSLPPEVRKDLALRLLESVESDEACERAAEDWLHSAAAPAFDALKADPSRAILDHIDGIPVFPLTGRAGDHVRPGMRTTTCNTKTLVAYALDESSDEIAVSILGVFRGGQDCEAALSEDGGDPEAR